MSSYYYAAFNAPCVSHMDDELQAQTYFEVPNGVTPSRIKVSHFTYVCSPDVLFEYEFVNF